MKAEELMIGDWVQLHYTDYLTREKVVKNVKIDQIRKYERTVDSYHAWSRESGNIGDVENLFPIPLTPEILEKNGFSGEGYNMGIVGFSKDPMPELKYGYEAFIWRDNYLQIDHGFTHFKKYIKYIHELQHALRLCGIDKQIEL